MEHFGLLMLVRRSFMDTIREVEVKRSSGHSHPSGLLKFGAKDLVF